MDIFNCLSGKAPASIFFRPRGLMIKLLNIICDQVLELYRTHAWNDVHFRLLAIEQGSRRFHVSLVICQPIIQISRRQSCPRRPWPARRWSCRHTAISGLPTPNNEPLVGYKYVRAALVREQGMVNVLVTNGTMEEVPWRAILPLIDAANIDRKGFAPEWYQRLGGDLETVKRSISLAVEQCRVEVTTLLIPGENDSEEEIRCLAQWLASIDPEIPLHLSRFFPRYQMTDKPLTAVERVYRLADVARECLPFVYAGNC